MEKIKGYNCLMNELRRLQEERDAKSNELLDLYRKKQRLDDKEYKEKYGFLVDQCSILQKKINEIEDEIFLLLPPIKSNGIIELRKNTISQSGNNSIIGDYIICRCDDKRTKIGGISYHGHHLKDIGDVNYTIYDDYKDQDYGYYGLCLLGELLKQNGIDDFWIFVDKMNNTVIKTIEQYGGEPIKFENNKYIFKACTFIDDEKMQSNRSK